MQRETRGPNLTYADLLRNPDDKDIGLSALAFSSEISSSLLSTTGFSFSGCTNRNIEVYLKVNDIKVQMKEIDISSVVVALKPMKNRQMN